MIAAGMLLQQALQSGAIAHVAVEKARRKRLKIAVEDVLTGGGQRGQRAAVEALVQRDDVIKFLALCLGRPLARDLDGAFVGLRAGVGEEHPLHPRARAEQLCQPCDRLAAIQV